MVGPATVFVSHAWKFPLSAALDVMLTQAEEEPEAYFWFDLFVNNQISAPALAQDWWATTFKDSIRTIGKVMLVLSPWSDPIPLTRAWCLWEILCAMDQDGVELLIRLPRSQRRGFHQGLVKNYDMVLETLMR
eukprot:UC1_evm1s1411